MCICTSRRNRRPRRHRRRSRRCLEVGLSKSSRGDGRTGGRESRSYLDRLRRIEFDKLWRIGRDFGGRRTVCGFARGLSCASLSRARLRQFRHASAERHDVSVPHHHHRAITRPPERAFSNRNLTPRNQRVDGRDRGPSLALDHRDVPRPGRRPHLQRPPRRPFARPVRFRDRTIDRFEHSPRAKRIPVRALVVVVRARSHVCARHRVRARVDRVAVASTAPRPAMAPSEGIFHKRRCDRWNPIGIF